MHHGYVQFDNIADAINFKYTLQVFHFSKTCDILHYEQFTFEDHPKSNLGNMCFEMITKHCHDEELVKKGTEEYHKVCDQTDSVVYSRMHLHIIARKK